MTVERVIVVYDLSWGHDALQRRRAAIHEEARLLTWRSGKNVWAGGPTGVPFEQRTMAEALMRGDPTAEGSGFRAESPEDGL